MATDHLAERYRPMSRTPRAVLVAVAVLLVGGLAGWLVWATVVNATPPADSRMLSFSVVDDHSAVARVQLDIADDAEDVQCRVRAFAADKSIVGEVTWRPEPGTDGSEEVTIATERRASAVEAVGCTAKGQPRPR